MQLCTKQSASCVCFLGLCLTDCLVSSWYANNCWCNEGRTDKTGWPKPYYEGNAKATVDYRFDAIKVDSCGASDNITAWREALDSAAAAAGRGRVQIENCVRSKTMDK